MLNSLIYVVFCNLGWFVCVMSAAAGRPWLGVLFAGVAIAYHLWRATQPRLELYLLLSVIAAAALWESLLTATGLLVYPNGILFAQTAPYWILALWALFTIQLNVLFRWLRGRYWLAAALGALAGPLSFRAGAALGAVHFPNQSAALSALAIGWTLWLPLLIALSSRWDGMRQATPSDSKRQTVAP
jgi:hypothetical protein